MLKSSVKFDHQLIASIVVSVVEFSPATRETGVRFPDNAHSLVIFLALWNFETNKRCE